MSETDKLKYRQIRYDDYIEEFDQLTNRSMVIQLDLADLKTLVGEDELVECYEGRGTLQQCMEMVRQCISSSTERIMIIAEALTLECLNQFCERVSRLAAPDANIIMGAMIPEEWEGLRGKEDDGSEHFGFRIVTPAKPIRMDNPLLLGFSSVLKSSKSTYTQLIPFAAGGTSICYKAVDADGSSVLIKEVYPISIGRKLVRDGDNLVPKSSNEKVAESVKTRLMMAVLKAEKEKELERDLQNDGRDFFEKNADYFRANNTFYTVYNDYGHGTMDSLSGKITLREAAVLTKRILEALDKLHASDYLHLDISPENILLGSEVDGVPQVKFIDLGSLVHRKMINRMESFPSKDGYSPFELFSATTSAEARDLIAPHTDTFSVGAVFYNLLTGRYVNWDVCRRGNMSIIKPDDAGIALSYGSCVRVKQQDLDEYYYEEDEFGDIDGDSEYHVRRIVNDLYVESKEGMVSPRILEAVNGLMAIAICNNPNRRFQDAHSMMKAMEGLIAEIDKHQYFFEKASMPADFMEHYISGESGMTTETTIPFVTKKIMDKRYEPEELRLALMKHKDILLEDGSLRHNREDVRDYIEAYRDKYHEIIFFDEGTQESLLFSGTVDTGYSDIKQLDCDEKTLIVFYGRKKALGSGIVKMCSRYERSSYALQLLLQKGKHPHVIRIVPSKLYNTAGSWLSFAFPFLCAAPVLLMVAIVWHFLTDPDLFDRLSVLFGMGYSDEQFMVNAVRETIRGCSLFGMGEVPKMGTIFGYNTDGSLILLNLMHHAGIIPAAAAIGLAYVLLSMLYDIAKRSYISMAAYVVLAARVGIYILSNLSLWPSMAGSMFTDAMGITVTVLLLAVSVYFGLYPRRGGERTMGWNRFRLIYGVVFQWFFRFVYMTMWIDGFALRNHSDPAYLLAAFALAWLLDVCIIMLKNNAKYRDFLVKNSFGDRVAKFLADDYEDDEYFADYNYEEEITVKKI
ncbi:MAG: hypothetical protein IIW34_00880 [Clostridia bacterium]|nr:hypothetical protein [Clostridia bacterium]